MKKKILFPKKKQIGKRPWGKEELLVLIPKILTLKKLTIKKVQPVDCNIIEKKMSVDTY